ncbi:rubrerythrin family protein [Caldisalinibacter kiritimatiensis]|uniref:Rubrerythrin n=1 Tax=Caldisalinibacter kiritimatiensis TaxID=1304284 RepID=R1AR77_9FIRM|nr:rubrerythrin family protein [Caldisalinibacter kiritimatiensis]EOC99662.1 Rubrerythrin [Caldisalinibacter kiritimatiensis]
MNAMTAENLRSAFGGESQAHMRYRVWAKKAEEEGFKNVATLFRAISYAEEVHASNHFEALKDEKGDFLVASGSGFGLGTTSENLQAAADGEMFEVEQMYPAYKAVAEMQGEKLAARFMHYALEAEKTHAELYLKAKDSVDEGKDFNIDSVHVCEICGYTTIDEAPDVCPVCGAKIEKFKAFSE